MLVDSMTRPSHPDILTPREQEVLALLREGLTNPRIAERLSITLDGAKYHVSEILGKLGVSSREEAARWQPAERPWWSTAIAPLAWPWRRANVSWLATAVAGVTAVLLVVGVGLLVWGLVRTDGDADASAAAGAASGAATGATAAASPTALLSPPTPTAEPPTPQPTPAASALPPTQPPPQAEAPPAPTPDPACAARDHNHLNIEKLRDQPTMADAVITEVDDDSIRIIFEGVEVIVSGIGSSLAIRTNLANERLAPLTRAIDAVANEC